MTSREKFEAWVSDNGKFQRALECKGGIYLLATINTQWEAWQAASEASEQQLLDMSVQLANAESKCRELAADNSAIKVMNDCLSEELRGYESNGAFDGPKMHLLWWKAETPATDAFLAEVRAQESKRVYESILDNPAVTDMGSLVDWLEQNANDSIAFAALLRKGVQS